MLNLASSGAKLIAKALSRSSQMLVTVASDFEQTHMSHRSSFRFDVIEVQAASCGLHETCFHYHGVSHLSYVTLLHSTPSLSIPKRQLA